MRHRFYSRELGRFVSVDPIGIWGDGFNLGGGYSYGASAPQVFFDPLGLQGQGWSVTVTASSADGGATSVRIDIEPDMGGDSVEAPFEGTTIDIPVPPGTNESEEDRWRRIRETVRLMINELQEPGDSPCGAIQDLGGVSSGPAGARFLHFEDGTTIDLRHWLAAADISQWDFLPVALPYDVVAANVMGWGVEVFQAMFEAVGGGGDSGHPFGGNEDLGSNLSGSLFTWFRDLGIEDLGGQIIDHLERSHGKMTDFGEHKWSRAY